MVKRSSSQFVLAAFAIACHCGPVIAQPSQPNGKNQETAGTAEGIAVSMRAMRDSTDTPESKVLLGATRLMGFLITNDELGADCILVFAKELRRPALRLDDLVVAHRNISAGTARPACTIDPRASTLKKLSNISQQIVALEDDRSIQRQLREWEQTGKEPQDVRVFNVEPETHFASVMVKADYDLKSICNGATPINQVSSLTDRLATQVQADISEAGTSNAPMNSHDRFWLNPGRVTYRSDNRLFMLGKCEVALLTEEEAITQDGERAGTNQPSPLAKGFANDLTKQFDELAKSKPVFRELENLYRAVAIMSLLHSQPKNLRGIVSDALDSIDVPRVQFNKTLAGKVSVKKLQGSVANGTYVLWLPSCGGVSIDIDLRSMAREKSETSVLPTIAKRISEARPGLRSVSWKISL